MKSINLYWWSEIYIQKKDKENYGDLLGKYLVEKISGNPVRWYNRKKFRFFKPSKTIYATIGSILGHIQSNWTVWGSGIISENDIVPNANFLAVRGPQSRKYLMSLGYQVPEVYGDPGLLLPDFYNPKNIEKKYEVGIIPHYNDFRRVKEIYCNLDAVKVIDLMTNDIEGTTREILECRNIISSSLHGIIISHAYQIPAVWIRFSDNVFGDGIKYRDYFESVGITPYVPEIYLNKLSLPQCMQYILKLPSLPDNDVMVNLKKGLMQSCPFK